MIKAALAEGFVTGYPDGTFRPDQTITRAEMAVMLSKAMKMEHERQAESNLRGCYKYPGLGTTLCSISERGLVQGRGGNLFVPGGITTRAEAAVTLLRLWKTLH